ncbi:hypothetical protein HDU81_004322 [Chytriomyces hyalinus]|nr:hypothetical protein HDU81_004322 [Chytriomyces hyalinus]
MKIYKVDEMYIKTTVYKLNNHDITTKQKTSNKMNSEPINIDDVDVNLLELVLPKKESSQNGRMFYIYHNGKKLRVILPTLVLPYGAGSSEKFPDKFTMCASFEGMEKTDEKQGQRLKRANDKLKAINDKICQLIMDKKDTVFKDKKKVTNEILVNRYKPFIVTEDGNPDKMYFKLQQKRVNEKDAIKMTESQKAEHMKQFVGLPEHGFLIDAKQNQVQVNTDTIRNVIPWGSRIKPVIEFAYLWVSGANQDCFPVWTFIHGMLVSTASLNNFALKADESDEENDENDENEENDDNEEDDSEMDTEDQLLANSQMQ